MVYDVVIKLMAEEKTIDEYGDTISEFTENEVFAEVKSIGQSEFYQAQALGLKPEIKFVLPDYLEYKGEKRLKFQGYKEDEEQEYTVLRTFRTGNMLELVCRRGID